MVTRGEWTVGGQPGGRAGACMVVAQVEHTNRSGVFCRGLEVSYLPPLCVPGLFIGCVTLGPGFNLFELQISHL